MKICFVASSGGHWEELMCLKEIMDRYETIMVSEKRGQINDVQSPNLYIVPQINRKENKFLIKFIKLFGSTISILIKEQPKVIITTGALVSFPFCLIGKFMGKKIIYIESFARLDCKSLTGKLVYPFADLFIVQWEELCKLYPKAIYGGSIF